MRASVAGSIPQPSSLTVSMTYGPGTPARCASTYSSSRSTSRVSIRSVPPFGIASRAFTARFTSTCSIWPGSALTRPRSGARSLQMRMSSPRSRASIDSMSATTVVQDEDRDLLDLLAAEREQLSRERGRPLGGAADLGDFGEGGVAQRTLRQELGVTKDRGEEVIEVVCDPAGELADSFHPGRLPALRLSPDPLLVVLLHSVSPEEPAGRPEDPPSL